MAYEQTGPYISLVTAADLSSYQYRAIKIDSNGKAALCGAADRAIGILQNDPGLGEIAQIMTRDTSTAEYGDTVSTPGVNLMSDSVGRLVPASGDVNVVGISLEAGVVGGAYAVLVTAANSAALGAGSVGTTQLADAAVTTIKIADLNVTTGKIAADGITGAKIADDVIDSEHYVDGSIDLAHLAADCVNGTKIADDAIDSEHYVDGSIDLAHLAADCVDGTKIADDAINSEHYVDGSIDTAHIGDLQVTTGKLAADAVDGTKIADDAIDSEHYVDGSIDLAHLAADCVDGTKIADDAINSEHYVDGSIDTAHIGDLQVTAAKLATDAVETLKIKDLNVTTGKLAADAVDGTKLADDAVNSEHIADGAVDVIHLATTAKPNVCINIPVTMAQIANGSIMTELTLPFKGFLVAWHWTCTVPVTTAAKAANLNLEIDVTNVTGGVLALAGVYILGETVDAAAITADGNEQFAAGQKLSIEASGVTTFIEGEGVFTIWARQID